MQTLLRITALTAAFACFTTFSLPAQMSMPSGSTSSQGGAKAPQSPNAEAHVSLNGKRIVINYASPQMRGRKIMGDLVPYGKVWRTGANDATSLTTETDLKIGDLNVPAGSYTLYTLPAAPGTPWQLIVNKQTKQWGTEYHQEQDLGRTPMKAGKLAQPQEGMSISFEKTSGGSTQLHIKWETTDEWVAVSAK